MGKVNGFLVALFVVGAIAAAYTKTLIEISAGFLSFLKILLGGIIFYFYLFTGKTGRRRK
ncbi:MAG: hypothetical protein L6Q29_01580 [Candidatus Pacebacteria bacterium]|nr:hypothetical protein [Candidatus Paceibacterota bacterium]NUQ57557.1 hypothetical protein [Candidatus Paceibacter sp.]